MFRVTPSYIQTPNSTPTRKVHAVREKNDSNRAPTLASITVHAPYFPPPPPSPAGGERGPHLVVGHFLPTHHQAEALAASSWISTASHTCGSACSWTLRRPSRCTRAPLWAMLPRSPASWAPLLRSTRGCRRRRGRSRTHRGSLGTPGLELNGSKAATGEPASGEGVSELAKRRRAEGEGLVPLDHH
jgi:hypothetical protein